MPSPLPFPFESRPIDHWIPGEREAAHQYSRCLACEQPVDYPNLSVLDQAEYRISYLCPTCFAVGCEGCELYEDDEAPEVLA